jgi:sulfur transfer complex TusBCD TusB component (DsrH family)
MNVDQEDFVNENNNRAVNHQPQMTDSAVIFRLDPEKVVRDIENYLSGGYNITYYDKTTDDYRTKFVESGKPLLNKEGIQNVLSTIKSVINHAVVQANFDNKRYERYLVKLHKRLAFILMNNKDIYGLKDNSTYHSIIQNIMLIVEPFLSRTIDNEERKGLTAMLKETVTTVRDKGKRFAGFGGK